MMRHPCEFVAASRRWLPRTLTPSTRDHGRTSPLARCAALGSGFGIVDLMIVFGYFSPGRTRPAEGSNARWQVHLRYGKIRDYGGVPEIVTYELSQIDFCCFL
jgi:hypothetical protein